MTGRVRSPEDPLGAHERVLVGGVTGVGKSTLCRVLAVRWSLPYTELDSLFHGPGWTVLPTFRDDVAAIAAAPRWVSELQYLADDGAGHLLAARAQVLLWLDWPRRIALPRLLRRTLARSLTQRELWNGNRERPIWRVLGGGPDNLLRWEQRTHGLWRTERIPELLERHPRLAVVRFRHPRDLRAWLDRNAPPAPHPGPASVPSPAETP